MHTSLRIEGANCPTCYNETLEALSRLDGVRAVDGSIAGPCIEIEHDEAVSDTIATTIRHHLHGVELISNEIGMTPVELVTIWTPCSQHATGQDTAAPPHQ